MKRLLSIIIVLLAFPFAASATTYYVDNTNIAARSTAISGSNPLLPWLTAIGKGCCR